MNKRRIFQRKFVAFSLIELMITIGIFAILIVVAIPSLTTMMMNAKIQSINDELVNALNYARSTALSQAMTVEVCPIGAVGVAACGANWTSGWIVITLPAAGVPSLLKSRQYTASDPSLSSTSAGVFFDRNGLATTQSNFKVCDTRGASFARSAQVLASGYVQMGSTPGQAVWNNAALTCP